MSPQEAKHTAIICHSLVDADWHKDWRDYMIGSFAYIPPHILVTKNLDDFVFLGDRVINPIDLMYPPRQTNP